MMTLGQDHVWSGHCCGSGLVIIRARRPRSIADVGPSSHPSCRQSLPGRRPDSGSDTRKNILKYFWSLSLILKKRLVAPYRVPLPSVHFMLAVASRLGSGSYQF